MQLSKQKGFTLVEIAIVLVIVGLLIGGVLKGQEMITNAKLKRIESYNTGLVAAMFYYQDRYSQLPGDDSGAEDRFTVYAAGDPVNGDGTGTIDGVWSVASTGDITLALTSETNMFFAHLRAAGVIPGGGVDDTKPTNAYGGQIGIQDGALNISGHVIIFGAIEGPIARIIEARLDDNAGDTGRLQSANSGDDMALPASAVAVYVDTGRYDMAFGL